MIPVAQTEVSEQQYGSWGRCAYVTDGIVELYITLDFGPRIIRFGLVGGENELLEDTDCAVFNDEVADTYGKFGKTGIWKIYGGHRLWVSPELHPACYYPDDEPVAYEKVENGVRLTPPQQKYTNLQMVITVTLQDGKVSILHEITNKGAFPVQLAPWALTVMAKGGKEFVPMPERDAGFLANRTMSLWSYTDLSDPRVTWGKKFIGLQQDPTATDRSPFKVGINNEDGYAVYFNHHNMFVKAYSPVLSGNYPDGGVSYETYTNQHILEMETLGELQNLSPEETMTHTETWALYADVDIPADEEQMKQIALKYNL